MVFDLLLIALAITLDPLPLMAFVLLVSSARGVWKGLVFILGWLACFVGVIAIVLAVTGGQPPAPKSPPSTGVLVAKLVIGVLLVVYGAHRHRRRRQRRDGERTPSGTAADRPRSPTASDPSVVSRSPEPAEPAGTTGRDDSAPSPGSAQDPPRRKRSRPSLGAMLDRGAIWPAAGVAVFLQPWGLVAAGAVTVVEANTSHTSTWLVLFGFCLLATASLLAAELYVVLRPARAQARLLALRGWMEAHAQQAIVLGCLLVGLLLTGKSIYGLTG
ncbi:GAP family protein [Streptomyces fructofermentans]|uniref:GAP family protein n=1 Tax=Streptomyces fructofermentans TaxID=152141 RepID=UPI0033C09B11